MTISPIVTPFWDGPTGSWQYVVHDPATRHGAIIDPVLDFDPIHARVSTKNADRILEHIRAQGLTIDWVLDTHPHADHFSAAIHLAQALGARRGIGAQVVEVQALWKEIYNLPDDFPTDGRQWDRLFADGDELMIGELPVRVMFTPGHTLASVSYIAGDAAFVADTLMMPESGTVRADFPGGSSAELYESLQRLLALPETTRVFVGHDYPDDWDDPRCEATVAEHRARNAHLAEVADKAAFVALRDRRDATLDLPMRMLAALQVNLRGGRLPEPEANGQSYLKIPLNRF
ncbi:MBL fold metallo-hydrolase [Rhodovulum marinum]|uniref:Glyoxylase-like metal-dependent hydrolase (Beta-lactamase superfamily II) n=1 Tax=Rhodovulum marinum TaxID=320662 RepID=A0A4R2PYN4_9RHOB|nr:MBL fold metallo-hydrolase [Rhodovulum marinum]TCP40318.1 glyoxylase-like metal-dependent hydrolase (beta-lactamase superfamily II) [Rhodovulum marinum]